jgi:hypothetical protein
VAQQQLTSLLAALAATQRERCTSEHHSVPPEQQWVRAASIDFERGGIGSRLHALERRGLVEGQAMSAHWSGRPYDVTWRLTDAGWKQLSEHPGSPATHHDSASCNPRSAAGRGPVTQ